MALLSLLAATLAAFALGHDVTISNVEPRREASGAVLDAHDSKLRYDAETRLFYWWAASYGNCTEPAGDSGCARGNIGDCGFREDHNVTLFTSPDLVSWTNRGVVFGAAGQLPPRSVLFAPKVVFNQHTSKYVLWFNYIVNDFATSKYAAAVSDKPEGPFTVVNRDVKMANEDCGDLNLFVDDDGAAFVIYTSNISAPTDSHRMSIEQLAPDYMSSLGLAASTGPFGDGFVEAPAMFKRGPTYYAAFGSCCCYCGAGSPVSVYTASSPLGPYTKQEGTLGDQRSQATDIFSYVDAEGTQQFMYVGDRWQSAPDQLKSHDFTVFAPIHFDDAGRASSPGFVDSFSVSLPDGEVQQVPATKLGLVV